METGLTFEQLSEIKAEIKRKHENSCAYNCGDFDKVFIDIINLTIAKVKENYNKK